MIPFAPFRRARPNHVACSLLVFVSCSPFSPIQKLPPNHVPIDFNMTSMERKQSIRSGHLFTSCPSDCNRRGREIAESLHNNIQQKVGATTRGNSNTEGTKQRQSAARPNRPKRNSSSKIRCLRRQDSCRFGDNVMFFFFRCRFNTHTRQQSPDSTKPPSRPPPPTTTTTSPPPY